jgi:hypothetical protein
MAARLRIEHGSQGGVGAGEMAVQGFLDPTQQTIQFLVHSTQMIPQKRLDLGTVHHASLRFAS